MLVLILSILMMKKEIKLKWEVSSLTLYLYEMWICGCIYIRIRASQDPRRYFGNAHSILNIYYWLDCWKMYSYSPHKAPRWSNYDVIISVTETFVFNEHAHVYIIGTLLFQFRSLLYIWFYFLLHLLHISCSIISIFANLCTFKSHYHFKYKNIILFLTYKNHKESLMCRVLICRLYSLKQIWKRTIIFSKRKFLF